MVEKDLSTKKSKDSKRRGLGTSEEIAFVDCDMIVSEMCVQIDRPANNPQEYVLLPWVARPNLPQDKEESSSVGGDTTNPRELFIEDKKVTEVPRRGSEEKDLRI